MTIDELLLENKKLYNEELTVILTELLDYIDLTDVEAVRRNKIAIAIAKGLTIYRAKELSEKLNISKTAVKYLINRMDIEGKIKLIKVYDYTFIELL